MADKKTIAEEKAFGTRDTGFSPEKGQSTKFKARRVTPHGASKTDSPTSSEKAATKNMAKREKLIENIRKMSASPSGKETGETEQKQQVTPPAAVKEGVIGASGKESLAKKPVREVPRLLLVNATKSNTSYVDEKEDLPPQFWKVEASDSVVEQSVAKGAVAHFEATKNKVSVSEENRLNRVKEAASTSGLAEKGTISTEAIKKGTSMSIKTDHFSQDTRIDATTPETLKMTSDSSEKLPVIITMGKEMASIVAELKEATGLSETEVSPLETTTKEVFGSTKEPLAAKGTEKEIKLPKATNKLSSDLEDNKVISSEAKASEAPELRETVQVTKHAGKDAHKAAKKEVSDSSEKTVESPRGAKKEGCQLEEMLPVTTMTRHEVASSTVKENEGSDSLKKQSSAEAGPPGTRPTTVDAPGLEGKEQLGNATGKDYSSTGATKNEPPMLTEKQEIEGSEKGVTPETVLTVTENNVTSTITMTTEAEDQDLKPDEAKVPEVPVESPEKSLSTSPKLTILMTKLETRDTQKSMQEIENYAKYLEKERESRENSFSDCSDLLDEGAMKMEVQEVTKQIEEEGKKFESLKDKVKRVSDKCSLLESELVSLTKEEKETESQISQAKNEIKIYERLNALCEEQVRSLSEEKKLIQDGCRTIEIDELVNFEILETIAEKEKMLEKLTTLLTEADDLKQNLKANDVKLTKQLEDVCLKITGKGDELKRIQVVLEIKEEELRRNSEKWDKEREQLGKELADIAAEEERLTEAMARLSSENEELKNRCEIFQKLWNPK